MDHKKEIEIVRHKNMKQLEVFVIEMTTRSPHGHDDMEIGMLLDGNVTMYTEKEAFSLRTGDIYIINRYQVHSFFSTEGNHILAFQINTELFKKIDRNLGYLHLENNIIHSGALYNYLRQSLYQCANYFFSDIPYSNLKCASLMTDMMYEILQNAQHTFVSKKESVNAQNNSLRINRITDYISEHYAEPVTLAQIAETEHISTYHISHFIKEMLGISFQEYLNNIRFEHALQLIERSDLNILDICLETGFSSSRYLNQMFQKYYGCSAREYMHVPDRPRLASKKIPTETVEKRYSFQQSAFFFHNYCLKAES